jgi:hypothetical protein
MLNNKNPSNVVALPGAELPAVRSASVHSPGVQIHGSRNEVWLCPAFSGGDTVMLYVKPTLSVPQMVAEMVVAQVGLCMGAPCAPPFIVSAAPHHFGRPRGRASMMFGCQQVGHNGLARPVRRLELMLEMLRKTQHAEAACLLDEWSANAVRGCGDLVFDPLGSVWLIDHEGALTPDVAPDEAVQNWIASRLIEDLTARQRHELLGRLRGRSVAAHRARLDNMPSELKQVVGGADTYRRLLKFLATRLEVLDSLISSRVIPEQTPLELRVAANEADRTAGV